MNPCKMMWFSYMMVISCVALTGSTGFCANGAIEGQVTLIGGGNTGHGIVIAISGGVAYGHYTVRFGPGYDGYYKIPQLPPGTYELHTQKEGYEYGLKKGVSVLSGQITTVYVALYPEGRITGKVTQSDQTTPIAGVVVTADDGSGFMRGATTDATGNYTINKLRAETYIVKGVKADCTISESQNVQVTSGQTTSGVNLVGVNGKISGTVTKSDGSTPIQGVFVIAKNSSGVTKARNITDALGHYKLTGLATGSYTVKAWRIEGPIAEVSGVSLTDGQTTNRNLAAEGGSISGTVKNSSQTPIQGAILTAKKDSGFYKTTSDASGNYKIEALPAGTYQVTVNPNGNDYVASKIDGVTVTANQETPNQNFILGPAGKISGIVKNSSQVPIEGALVLAVDLSNPDEAYTPTTTNINGNYTVNYLRTGTYTIFVSAEGYVSDSETGVSVTAGQTTSNKNFTLGTSGGTISGTVYKSDGTTPIEGAMVQCTSEGKSWGYTMTNSNGQYSLTLLQAGVYTVTACADGYSMEILDNIVVTVPYENSGNNFTLDEQ